MSGGIFVFEITSMLSDAVSRVPRFQAASALLLGISFLCGVIALRTRGTDLRVTAGVARDREAGATIAELQPARSRYHKLGRLTLFFSGAQYWLFLAGLAAAIADYGPVIWAKVM